MQGRRCRVADVAQAAVGALALGREPKQTLPNVNGSVSRCRPHSVCRLAALCGRRSLDSAGSSVAVVGN